MRRYRIHFNVEDPYDDEDEVVAFLKVNNITLPKGDTPRSDNAEQTGYDWLISSKMSREQACKLEENGAFWCEELRKDDKDE